MCLVATRSAKARWSSQRGNVAGAGRPTRARRRGRRLAEERAGFAQAAMEPDQLAVAERLRKARGYVGLKQEDVAKHLDIARSALQTSRHAELYRRPVTWFTSDALSPLPASFFSSVSRSMPNGRAGAPSCIVVVDDEAAILS